MELRHLAFADRILREGQSRIDAQVALIQSLRDLGADSGAAEDLLHLFRDTLAEWQHFQAMIVASLNESSALEAAPGHA